MTAAPAGPSSGLPAAAPAPADVEADPAPVQVSTNGGTVVLAVGPHLDEAAGGALIDAASAALGGRPCRIDVDLRSLDSFTDAGARALVGCRSLGAQLPEGLHYRTGRGAGREALLAAYSDVDTSPSPR